MPRFSISNQSHHDGDTAETTNTNNVRSRRKSSHPRSHNLGRKRFSTSKRDSSPELCSDDDDEESSMDETQSPSFADPNIGNCNEPELSSQPQPPLRKKAKITQSSMTGSSSNVSLRASSSMPDLPLSSTPHSCPKPTVPTSQENTQYSQSTYVERVKFRRDQIVSIQWKIYAKQYKEKEYIIKAINKEIKIMDDFHKLIKENVFEKQPSVSGKIIGFVELSESTKQSILTKREYIHAPPIQKWQIIVLKITNPRAVQPNEDMIITLHHIFDSHGRSFLTRYLS